MDSKVTTLNQQIIGDKMIKKDYKYLSDRKDKTSWADFNMGIIFGFAVAAYGYFFMVNL